jgi:hypothetical protein
MCQIPVYEQLLKNNSDKILNILSLGSYSVLRTHKIIEKYNQEMDIFHKCIRDNYVNVNQNAPSALYKPSK